MRIAHFLTTLLWVSGVMAASPESIVLNYAAEAKRENPAFLAFDAGRGDVFFHQKHGGEWSCSSCHTDNPAEMGRHVVTQKTIHPMVQGPDSDRFEDPHKIEKWFKRNCKDVLSRECTALEKGDVLTYLLSIQKPR
jgi:hypothetical protein